MKNGSLKAIDFFCGAGGMSYGLLLAGIQVLGGIDIDHECQGTYESNISQTRFLNADITKLSPESVGSFFGIRPNEPDLVFCGCSPCQFWSRVNTDRTRNKSTAFLLTHFERFVSYFRPTFIVIENVPGLLTKKAHSILPEFQVFLENQGYSFSDGVLNANDYGVPQHRLRYLLIAALKPRVASLPPPKPDPTLTVRRFVGGTLGKLSAGGCDPADHLHRAARLSPMNLERLKRTPPDGGTRSSWSEDPKLQLRAYKGKDGSFTDVYGRMFWDRPAPTITTRFNSLSNGRFGHPEQNRAISLREGALLQTFPCTFSFQGVRQASLTKQIGNAVPPELARRIGLHLRGILTRG